MNQFYLHHGQSSELAGFPHISEIGIRKITSIQLDSLVTTATSGIRIYYILDGKFEWNINNRCYVLYPGDLAIILPGQKFGGTKGFMDIGTVCWLCLEVNQTDQHKKTIVGNWSGLSKTERLTISKILQLNNTSVLARVKEAFTILQTIKDELSQQEVAYTTRVNHLIDELLILIVRQSTYQTNLRRDFPQTFTKLEQTLREDLARQWTVEEMAALIGLGTTAFSEKVKN